MLTASGVMVAIPDPLPGDGGGDPDPTGWPTTADPVLLAMRPAGRTVASGTATDAATFDSLAVSTAEAVTAEGQGAYLAWNYGGPDYRTTVFMEPGSTYPGGGAYDWRALVGTDPAERSVMEKRDNSGGVVHSFGSIYMENLHLAPQTTVANSAPKYPWHITGGKMCIAANCAFDLSQIESDTIEGGEGIAGWVGADGDSGMTIVLYKCDFIPGVKANTLNIHDGGPPDHPMTLIFVDCTGLDDVELVCPGSASGDGQKNRMYVIDTACASLSADGDGEIWTNGAAPAAGGSSGTIHRGVTDWPIPEGGLSEFWQDHYYPSSVGTTYTYTPTVTDAAPFQPVVGRTYYTRVRPDRAGRYTHSGVTCTTTGGMWAGRLQVADTEYDRDVDPTIESLTPDMTLVSGANQKPGYYAYSRYPGDNGFWVSVEFSSASARVTGSAELAGITECFYTDDGSTIVPVAAGTAHPLPSIRAT